MSHESSLLKEVVNHPDQMEPRLVLADWYEENGNPRGELIRVQCQMSEMHWADPGYSEMEEVEDRLLKKYRSKWLKELPKWKNVTWGNYESVFNQDVWDEGRRYFKRGFVESASVRDLKTFRANLANLKSSVVSFVSLSGANTRGSYDLLKKVPNLRGVSIPSYSDNFNPEWLNDFPQRENLSALELTGQGIGGSDSDWNGLFELELPSLSALDLSSNTFGTLPAMKRFLKWGSLENLRWLNLGLTDLCGDDGPDPKIISTLAKEGKLKDLCSLSIWGNDLGDRFIKEFTKSAKMKNLVELNLSNS